MSFCPVDVVLCTIITVKCFFCAQQSEAVSLLAEMFPTVSTSELILCLSLAAGSTDAAAQHVLERMESYDENSSSPDQVSAVVFSHHRKFINPKVNKFD